MKISIDFDGTVVEHRYPDVGPDVPHAAEVLRELATVGHKLILFTMRDEEELETAVQWFEKNNIPLFGVNTDPEQKSWTSSPKAYAELNIDDRDICCPLVYPPSGERPYVDWKAVAAELRNRGILPQVVFGP